ncbi:MAG: phage tail sheath family protein [Kofleriaceae bacterium]
MSQLLSSKVVIEEEPPRIRSIAAAATSVLGAVGIAQRGPIDQAVLCTSFDEYEATFGGFIPDADLTLAALGFFTNGGSALWAVRTVHHTDVTDPTTVTAVRGAGFLVAGGGPSPAMVVGSAAPVALANGDQIVLAVHGGADVAIVFTGERAAVLAGGGGPYALADSQSLTVRIDSGLEQTIAFAAADFTSISSATAAEVAAAINAELDGGRATAQGGVLRIASDMAGAASRIQVTGGTANVVLGFPTTLASGAGNVADLSSVTFAEIEGLVEATVSGVDVRLAVGGGIELRTVATGPAATLQVGSATAAAFGFDTLLHTGSSSGTASALRVEGLDPGGYANQIEAEVRAATSGAVSEFDLAIIQDGVYRERFPNLSMDPTSARYVEVIVNDERTGSRLVRVVDQLLAGQPVPSVQIAALSGGDDGLSGLTDLDFIGSAAAKTGMYALDRVLDLTLLAVPARATPAVHDAMITYCEVERAGSVFAVLDPPAQYTAAEVISYVETTAGLLNRSEFGAIYWPRVKILNPQKSAFGSAEQIVVAPSGWICGVYARTDAGRPGGIYDPPAGTDKGQLHGVYGFETDEVLEERKRDLVYPKRINPLTTGPGMPRFIDGSRTLKGDGNFPYVAERRGAIFIAQSLKAGVQFARHKNNTEGLRSQVRRSFTAFLITQMNNGAFRSREPAKAFFVDVSDQLNPPSVIFAGQLVARVGLATNKPAEFIVIRISQDTRALEAELAAAGVS